MDETFASLVTQTEAIYANPQVALRRPGVHVSVDLIVVMLALLDEVRTLRRELAARAALEPGAGAPCDDNGRAK